MNVDQVLTTFNERGVRYILIGGMNFLLRHEPVVTFDIDLWIEDSAENRRACEAALSALDAEWGDSEANWGKVAAIKAGWLDRQGVFCLASPYGAIDVFRSVLGLDGWGLAWDRADDCSTAGGVRYRSLSDSDMLACQMAIEPGQRKLDRIRVLEAEIARRGDAGRS